MELPTSSLSPFNSFIIEGPPSDVQTRIFRTPLLQLTIPLSKRCRSGHTYSLSCISNIIYLTDVLEATVTPKLGSISLNALSCGYRNWYESTKIPLGNFLCYKEISHNLNLFVQDWWYLLYWLWLLHSKALHPFVIKSRNVTQSTKSWSYVFIALILSGLPGLHWSSLISLLTGWLRTR